MKNPLLPIPEIGAAPGAAPSPADAERTRRARVMFAVLSTVFMALLDVFIVNVAFPAIARHFSATETTRLSWLLNAYAIVFAALLVPAGRWADRWGRRRIFLAGLALFTVASALCAGAISVGMLIGARVLQAIGAALLSPAATALLLLEFPPGKRSSAVALLVTVGGVAAALGAPVGGLLSQLSWHWVFLVNLPTGVAAWIVGARALRENRGPADRQAADLTGAVLLMATVGCLVLGTVKGGEWGWTSPAVIGCGVATLLLGVGFVRRAQWHPAPVVELPMLRERTFAAANASALLFASAFGALILANVIFMARVWQSSPWRLGLQLAPGPLAAAALALLVGRWCERWSPRPFAVAGALFFLLGCFWFRRNLGPVPRYLNEFLPGSILTGLGVGLSLPSVSSAALVSLPPSRLSTGAAVLTMSRQIGTALGVAILVAIIGDATASSGLGRFRIAYATMGLAALGSGAAAFGLAAPKQNSPPNGG
ncbi:MAG TPA: MFS transporter [Candidatus Didemnitutus sp.]|jgi:EmrB/QacA subfamily drug resistance transporter